MSAKELFETFWNYSLWQSKKYTINEIMSYFSLDPLVAIGTAAGEIEFGRNGIRKLYLKALNEIKEKNIQITTKSQSDISYKAKIFESHGILVVWQEGNTKANRITCSFEKVKQSWKIVSLNYSHPDSSIKEGKYFPTKEDIEQALNKSIETIDFKFADDKKMQMVGEYVKKAKKIIQGYSI